MSVGERLADMMTGLFGPRAVVSTAQLQAGADQLNWPALYRMLRLMYYNNRVYQELRGADREAWMAVGLSDAGDLRGLRNPTHAAVNFYSATVWPDSVEDAFPLDNQAQNAALPLAFAQILEWSNFEYWRPIIPRRQAALGEVFLKVATRPDDPADGDPRRVFLQAIDPDYASGEIYDERGFLEYIRFDAVDVETLGAGRVRRTWHIEVWDKARGAATFWDIESDRRPDDAKLRGTRPTRTLDILAVQGAGADFLPIARLPFSSSGAGRGEAAIIPAFDKIVELDQMASSLHTRLYRHNKPDWALEAVGASTDGLVMPPVEIGDLNTGGEVLIGGEGFYNVPAGYRLSTLIPNVDYASQREAIAEHWEALLETDLSELNYGRLSTGSGELSGRAIRYKLTPAIKKAGEARGNADAGLIRAVQMAATIGSNLGVFRGIEGIPNGQVGSYARGDLAFRFRKRAFIPEAPEDEADLLQSRAAAFAQLIGGGLTMRDALLVAGFPQVDVDRIAPEAAPNGTGGAQGVVVPGAGGIVDQ